MPPITPHASALGFIAASTAAAVTATAPAPEPVASTVLLWVPLGVLAGTFWRAQFWYVKNVFQGAVFRADVCAIAALIMLALGGASYFSWDGPVLGSVACLGALVGVDPFRKAFERVIANWWPPGIAPQPPVFPPEEGPPP